MAPSSLRLAVLISGRGSNMAAIARECRTRRLAAEISVVISDRPEAAGLGVAAEMGIPTQVIPWQGAAGRDGFEKSLTACLDSYDPDLVVLAGFMRVLSAGFVNRHAGRMINIHPSLLPRYTGLHTHRRALEAGDARHGASVHYVTPQLDSGPVVLQSEVPVHPGDTEEVLAERVIATEHVIYPRVIGWISAGRLRWREGQPWLDGQALREPLVERFDGP